MVMTIFFQIIDTFLNRKTNLRSFLVLFERILIGMLKENRRQFRFYVSQSADAFKRVDRSWAKTIKGFLIKRDLPSVMMKAMTISL